MALTYKGSFLKVLTPRAKANRSFNEGRQPPLSVIPQKIADLDLVYSTDDPMLFGRYELRGEPKAYNKRGEPQHVHYLLNYNVVEKVWEVEDGKKNIKFPDVTAAVSHIKSQR